MPHCRRFTRTNAWPLLGRSRNPVSATGTLPPASPCCSVLCSRTSVRLGGRSSQPRPTSCHKKGRCEQRPIKDYEHSFSQEILFYNAASVVGNRNLGLSVGARTITSLLS